MTINYYPIGVIPVHNLVEADITCMDDSLIEVMQALATKMRGVKYYAFMSENYPTKVFVAVEGETYTRGYLYLHDGNYCVVSRLVSSKRYRRDNIKHNTLSSKSLTVFLRKACKVLLPVDNRTCYGSIRPYIDGDHLTQIRNKSRQIRDSGWRLDDMRLLSELIDMYNTGHVFNSSEFQSHMPKLKEAFGDYSEFLEYSEGTIQLLHFNADGSVFAVQSGTIEYVHSHYTEADFKDNYVEYATVADLPESWQGRVSMLQMNNKYNTYLAGVGVMIDTHIFTIHEDV